MEIFCPWEASTYLFFSSNVPELIHYSHGVATFSSLAIGLLIFISNPKNNVSKLFLLFNSLFISWATLDVILWATNNPSTVMFAWSMQVLLEPLTYATAFFLFYYYLNSTWPTARLQSIVLLVLLPLILFLPTDLNLNGLLLSSCESTEGPIALYYSYFANLVFVLLILVTGFLSIPKLNNRGSELTALYFGIGLLTFLLAFTSGNIISSFSDDWTISQYGLFGMPIFASLIAYSIVKFKAFNVKVAGAQVLVVILWILVGSLLLIVKSDTSKLVAATTLIFTTFAGYFLVRSVKREIKQREQIEQLASGLEQANDQLKVLDKMKSEFVSIASHQLRSPLTAVRGYSSMILEGSFGPVPDKAKDAVERIAEASRFMASSVEDYLNVSRIQAGNMKYEYSDFNLKDLASRVADDTRQIAIKKGLLLTFKTAVTKTGIVHADIGKTRQIIDNLVNNSLKYTPKGSIEVLVRDEPKAKKIFVEIKDTGIGMSPKTIENMFGKFERASNANEVNVTGTGLGLYIARKMAREMGGDVSAHSEGEGKGSLFRIELPLMM